MTRTNYTYAFLLAIVASVACYLAGGGSAVDASDATKRLFDRSVAHVESGSSWIDVTAADYTSYQVLLTIEPEANTALNDVRIAFDLDQGDGGNGFNGGGYTSETIRFAIGRKFAGSDWRIDNEVQTAAISGTNAASRSVTLNVGLVGADEDLRVYVLVSGEQTDVNLPFLVMYRAPTAATFTTVSN